jgi:hypothetical protein
MFMKDEESFYSYGNKVLYQMCSEKPLHEDVGVIVSKLWLIGRAYAATIERKAGPGFKIDEAAEIIKNSDIDESLLMMKGINRLDESNLALSLDAHSKLTSVLEEATGIKKRSLASKYLHFHMPNGFFIYDSIANREVRKKLRSDKPRFNISKSFDDEYESFSLRCLHYRDKIHEPQHGVDATPRQIDRAFLGY